MPISCARLARCMGDSRSARNPLIAYLGVEPQPRDVADFRERRRKLGGGIVGEAPSELGEDRCAGMVAHADDEGESEPLAIGGVEPREPGEFLVVEAVETDAALLRPRGCGHGARARELAPEFRMAAYERELGRDGHAMDRLHQ